MHPAVLLALLLVPATAQDDLSSGGAADLVSQMQATARAGAGRPPAAVPAAASSPASVPAASAPASVSVGPARWDVDLSAEFPDDGGNQGSIGDCHDFTAVNLLEAALARHGGIFPNLSAADLFVQHTVRTDHFLTGYRAGRDTLQEGDYPAWDAAYGIAHRIATSFGKSFTRKGELWQTVDGEIY